MITFGSLFAGIGGFDLGLERAGMRAAWQVEIDPFCQRVLAKHWPNVKRYGDIKECGAHNLEPVDLICGGVPCQPASVAGKQRGTADDRWLWPEAFRIVREVRPQWLLFENVTGILALESGVVFESLLSELEALGYAVETLIIPACGVDAPHRRDRCWLVGYAEHNGSSSTPPRPNREVWCAEGKNETGKCQGTGQDVADSEIEQGSPGNNGRQSQSLGRAEQGESGRIDRRGMRSSHWLPEPNVGRVAHGVPSRVDRLKALGNAVVPQVVEVIGRAINECEGVL